MASNGTADSEEIDLYGKSSYYVLMTKADFCRAPRNLQDCYENRSKKGISQGSYYLQPRSDDADEF